MFILRRTTCCPVWFIELAAPSRRACKIAVLLKAFVYWAFFTPGTFHLRRKTQNKAGFPHLDSWKIGGKCSLDVLRSASKKTCISDGNSTVRESRTRAMSNSVGLNLSEKSRDSDFSNLLSPSTLTSRPTKLLESSSQTPGERESRTSRTAKLAESWGHYPPSSSAPASSPARPGPSVDGSEMAIAPTCFQSGRQLRGQSQPKSTGSSLTKDAFGPGR
jgi:hypothetical protein